MAPGQAILGAVPGHQLSSAGNTAASSSSGSTAHEEFSFPSKVKKPGQGCPYSCHRVMEQAASTWAAPRAPGTEGCFSQAALQFPTHTQRTPQSGRAVSLFPQGAWAMSAQATLRRQYPGVEEVASEPVLPRHHPPRAVGPLDWAEVDSSQGDVPRCHAFKLDPPQKAGKARPAEEARGKDL